MEEQVKRRLSAAWLVGGMFCFMIGLACMGAVGLAGCGADGMGSPGGCDASTATATHAVSVADFSFDPDCLKVAAGSTVTWTNTGMASHTVTSAAGASESFDSGALGAGGTFQHTFLSPGVFDYVCTPHEGVGMVGSVVVE
jgi:plastocyanin